MTFIRLDLVDDDDRPTTWKALADIWKRIRLHDINADIVKVKNALTSTRGSRIGMLDGLLATGPYHINIWLRVFWQVCSSVISHCIMIS